MALICPYTYHRLYDGTTPLMLVVQGCWDRAVDQLLERGASVYRMKDDDNIMVLHFAIQFCADPENKRCDIPVSCR